MKFGIFDHLEAHHGVSLADLYEGRLKLMEQADRSGFYSWLVAEHHHSPLCMAPNQMVLLSAAAMRTRTIKIGSMVTVLPLHHPIRVIEEICMLDHLTKGRAQLGVGKGPMGTESKMWGDNPEERGNVFTEGLRIVLQGLQHDFVSVKGKYFSFEDLWMALRPYQTPHPPLWYGENAAFAGRSRMNLMCHGSTVDLIGKIKTYLEAFAKAKPSWEDGVAHNDQPVYGATRRVYLAPTMQEAMERARASYVTYIDNYRKPHPSDIVKDGRRQPLEPIVRRLGPAGITFDQGISGETLVIGTPSTLRDHLRDYMRRSGANYYGMAFQWGDISHEEASSSMKLFVDEVMPMAEDVTTPDRSVA